MHASKILKVFVFIIAYSKIKIICSSRFNFNQILRKISLKFNHFVNIPIISHSNMQINLASKLQIVIASYIMLGLEYQYNIHTLSLIPTSMVYANEAKVMEFNDINRLKYGLREINYLLDNWDDKTTYCNFGEFQNELLTSENKLKLFKAAAETGLLDYDKSATMNVLCRKDPQVVRGFLGLTDDNTVLNKAEILMKKKTTLERVDSDYFDEYIDAVEAYTQAISSIDTLSYNARSDFASQQTNTKQNILLNQKYNELNNIKKDYLALCKDSVIIARDNLKFIVEKLNL